MQIATSQWERLRCIWRMLTVHMLEGAIHLFSIYTTSQTLTILMKHQHNLLILILRRY